MKYTITILSAYLLFITGCTSQLAVTAPPLKDATGVVYNDGNGNSQQDAWELGISNVKVSNGTDVVTTDSNGFYKLDVSDDCIVFVIKPASWKTPLDENNLPKFYYINKPAGSPEGLQFAGIKPTGPTLASIDFPLQRQYESDKFNVILFGDIQTGDKQTIKYFRRQLAEVIGTEADFGVSLGDNVFNNLSELDDINEAVATMNLPWYNVAGNHDLNLYGANNEADSLETFKSIYGPANYSFDYAKVHFIVLDSIITKKAENEWLDYNEGLGTEQLTFIANDLKHVAKDKLIVLLMHGGLQHFPKENLNDLFEIIDSFDHTFSIAGHDHFLTHFFYDETKNFNNPNPHHYYIAGAVCGSWWMGTPNPETGIPHSMMYDGAPSGYTILSLDKNNYSLKYKGFGKPADHQMAVYAPDEITTAELATTEVIANVFIASEKATVEIKIDNSDTWLKMAPSQDADPHFLNMVKWEEQNNIQRPDWAKNPYKLHMWKSPLPENLSEGLHTITVRSTNMFSQTFTAKRLIKVTE